VPDVLGVDEDVPGAWEEAPESEVSKIGFSLRKTGVLWQVAGLGV
jgi:hypothetical protein